VPGHPPAPGRARPAPVPHPGRGRPAGRGDRLPYRALVLVAAYGGLRIGELAGLTRRRVDLLRDGTVEVVEIITEVEGQLGTGQPKTRAGRRTVGLPRRVVIELEQHLATYTAPGPDAYVFTAPAGGPLRATGFRGRVWRSAIVAAGLESLKVHELRHTAVALWIAAGASPKEVAAPAGHTSVSFTLDCYGGLSEGHTGSCATASTPCSPTPARARSWRSAGREWSKSGPRQQLSAARRGLAAL
jgi:integrase